MNTLARLAIICLMATVTACAGATITLPEGIDSDFDLEDVLEELRDCDRLSETFVAVVREAATELDDMAASEDGAIPTGVIAEKIDAIAASTYFDVAEGLGCNIVQQRVETLDRLGDLDPESAAGNDLVTDIIRDMATG